MEAEPDEAAEDVVVLDLVGLKCPYPALRTAKALAGMRSGARLMVRCSDPMAAIDIPHLCNTSGHRLLATEKGERLIRFVIERGG